MVNSGAIMSAALLLYMVKPELSISEKYEFVHQFFKVRNASLGLLEKLYNYNTMKIKI
jgi:hypothetical protein